MMWLISGALFLMTVLVPDSNGFNKKRVYLDNMGTFNDPYPYCGHRFLGKDADKDYNAWKLFWSLRKRIVGGTQSAQGSWPWQVALLFNNTQVCAGSLINRDWIVSAGHCFHDAYSSTKPEHWNATLGEHKLKDTEEFEQVRPIESITIHPKYFYSFTGPDVPPDYDIALVKLATPADIDDNVYPICLLRPGQEFKPGKKCTVTGWGHTRFSGNKPPALNEAEVKIVSPQTCNKKISYGGIIKKRSMCAGFERGGVDACQFDSGGPLSCEENGQYYLTGVVSWGHECARPHKYGVYSNMAVLSQWVVDTISNMSA